MNQSKNPLKNQPIQSAWLKMADDEQAYWLLKLIDHYRPQNTLMARQREDERYQTGTMFIRVDGYDHHQTEVAAAVSRSCTWLVNNGLIQQDPAQTNGIYSISPRGYDLIDLNRGENEIIETLIEFVTTKNQLNEIDVAPMDVLGIFANHVTKKGIKPQQHKRDINNRIAVNLSRHNKANITLKSLQEATNHCLTRNWLKQRYVSSASFESIELTQLGLEHYDKNKEAHSASKKTESSKPVKRQTVDPMDTHTPDNNAGNSEYINHIRIEELRDLQHANFDTSKLVQLCLEINLSYNNCCFYAVASLVRTLTDHIPPIFGASNFDGVANNYGGSKITSFKKSMTNLSNSAKNISDRNLHQQIRRKEPLLNSTQIDFSNDIDVLLQEVVAILGSDRL